MFLCPLALIGLSFPQASILDYIAPALLATLALFFGFLLTGISFLRERSQGTLERLMASPVSRLDIVLGYGAHPDPAGATVEAIREAHLRMQSGHAFGKIVVRP